MMGQRRLWPSLAVSLIGWSIRCAPFAEAPDLAGTRGADAAIREGATTDLATSDAGSRGDAPDGEGSARPRGIYEDTVVADSPVGYWRLGETTGTTANARFGGPDGTLSGSPSLGVGSLIGDTDRAISFDGSDDRIDFGNVHGFAGSASFSVEVWLRPSTTLNQWRRVIAKEAGNQAGWSMQLLASSDPNANAISFRRCDATGEGEAASSPFGLQAGTRYHVVGTYDGAAVRLYVDGALMETVQATRSAGSSTSPLRFGMSSSWTNADRYTGTLDEVAIYAIALSPTRIQAHYDAGR
jgi:hypothetical protein